MSDDKGNDGPVGRLGQIGIDVGDLDRGARFWSAVLGLKEEGRHGQYLQFQPQEGITRLYLQKVPEKKTSKTRVHLDIKVKDLDAGLARVEALGGRKVEVVKESGTQWIVVLDPDDNEFCLIPDRG